MREVAVKDPLSSRGISAAEDCGCNVFFTGEGANSCNVIEGSRSGGISMLSDVSSKSSLISAILCRSSDRRMVFSAHFFCNQSLDKAPQIWCPVIACHFL